MRISDRQRQGLAVAVAAVAVLVPAVLLTLAIQSHRGKVTATARPTPSVDCSIDVANSACPVPTPVIEPSALPTVLLPSPSPSVVVTRPPVFAPAPRPLVGLWTQEGGDAAHDSFNPTDTGLTLRTLAGFRNGWFTDSSSTSGGGMAAATISGKWVYFAGQDAIGAYVDDPGCHKLGRGEPGFVGACRPAWIGTIPSQHQYPDTFAQPAVARGILYIASSSNADGIWAFNAAGCGKYRCLPLWHYPADSNLFNLTVDGDNVIASGTGYTAVVSSGTQTTSNHGMWVFPAGGCGGPTCGPKWVAEQGSYDAPAVGGGVIYSFQGDIEAYAESGCAAAVCQPLWKAAGPASKHTFHIAYSSGRLYVAGDTNLRTIDSRTGAILWEAGLPSPDAYNGVSAPAIGYGNVYVVGGDGTLVAFDATTGARRWSAPGFGPPQALALADNLVFVSTGTYYPANTERPAAISALPAAGCGGSTCGPAWSTQVSGNSPPWMVVANARLYVLSDQVVYQYYSP